MVLQFAESSAVAAIAPSHACYGMALSSHIEPAMNRGEVINIQVTHIGDVRLPQPGLQQEAMSPATTPTSTLNKSFASDNKQNINRLGLRLDYIA